MVEVLERTRPYEEFQTVVQAALRRLESEGIHALVSIHFYASPDSTEVGALLTFSDRDQMMKHICMISEWDEFRAFFGVIKPIDVRVYGRLRPEVEAWVRQFDCLNKTFDSHVAGFVR